jgi:hypothetical protein
MFEKHDLKSGDGIVLEFTGTQSSLYLNQQYLGYHVANVVNEYNFMLIYVSEKSQIRDLLNT